MKTLSSLNFLLVRRYDFLVVFRQVPVWDRRSAGRARVGMVCGAGVGKISQTPAGAGKERTKFSPRRGLYCRNTGWTRKIKRWPV